MILIKTGELGTPSIYAYSSNILCYTFIQMVTVIKHKSKYLVLMETETSSLHCHRGIPSCNL